MSVWKYEKNHTIQKRLVCLSSLFLLFIFVLLIRLFYLQILQGDKFLLLAEKNRLSIRLTIPERGRIYDRNGVVLEGDPIQISSVKDTWTFQKEIGLRSSWVVVATKSEAV